MDPIQFPESFAGLSIEQLTELRSQALTQLQAVAGQDPATITNLAAAADEAERLQRGIVGIDAEIAAQHAATARLAAAQQFTTANAEPPAAPEPAVAEPVEPVAAAAEPAAPAEPPAAEPPAAEPAAPAEPAAAPAPAMAAASAAGTFDPSAVAGARPAVPAARIDRFHAAADVPGLGNGQPVDFDQIATSLAERFERFPRPEGPADHRFGDDPAALSYFGHASISKGIPQELMIDPRTMSAEQIEEVFARATDQSRLPGGSLVAATGWCSPSETSYTFADSGSTNEGMVSVPEVGAPRGGIRHTLGPDWADIYALTNYFKNTEAAVIAGSATKPCFTVACPTWDDHRLDAYGYCFTVPFLTEAAYPELIKKYLQESILAYQHKFNADKITTLVGLVAAAAEDLTAAGIGSLATTLFGRIALVLDRERTTRRWGMNSAVEAKLPMWVKNAIKTDIMLRSGTDFKPVTDAQVDGLFSAINTSVQWLYDWAGQDLADDAAEYPASFEMIAYKAGTFVGLTLPVVNLHSVYDAASNALNQYTGVFYEEGYAMVRMGYGGVRLEMPTCIAGLTGTANVTCTPTPPVG